jgi:hypothetical protein
LSIVSILTWFAPRRLDTAAFDKMSSQDRTTDETPATKPDGKHPTWVCDCVVLAGDNPDAAIVAAGGPVDG